MPFGLVKVGPDTRGAAGNTDYLHCSGYHYDDDAIHGFTHTRGHGIGIVDYGAVMLMPRALVGPVHSREHAHLVLECRGSAVERG